MSSRKTTYFPLPQRIISKYDFCRRHHTVEKFAFCRLIFSTQWNNFESTFPRNGTTLGKSSTLWKIDECRAQVRRTPGEREFYSGGAAVRANEP